MLYRGMEIDMDIRLLDVLINYNSSINFDNIDYDKNVIELFDLDSVKFVSMIIEIEDLYDISLDNPNIYSMDLTLNQMLIIINECKKAKT